MRISSNIRVVRWEKSLESTTSCNEVNKNNNIFVTKTKVSRANFTLNIHSRKPIFYCEYLNFDFPSHYILKSLIFRNLVFFSSKIITLIYKLLTRRFSSTYNFFEYSKSMFFVNIIKKFQDPIKFNIIKIRTIQDPENIKKLFLISSWIQFWI